MKKKGLIIATVAFFVIINTSYFWEGKLGLLAFPIFFLLIIFYTVLAFSLIRQIIFCFKEKFSDKRRLTLTVVLLIVLVLTFFQPSGVVDFDRLSGKDLLIAQREGGGNCTTTFKLKDNNTFRERSVCFGVTEVKGHYELKGDSIIFKDIDNGRQNEYYAYALIKPVDTQNDKIICALVLYKNKIDTNGLELFIIKNDLKSLTVKSRTANTRFAGKLGWTNFPQQQPRTLCMRH